MSGYTFDPTFLVLGTYAALKFAASIWICKHEFQYPIWNDEGIQIERRRRNKAWSFIRNWIVNPEWGLMKAVAFPFVFLATVVDSILRDGSFDGMRHIHAYLPWRVQKTPPFCKRCNDKGRYKLGGFVKGEGGEWTVCDCQTNPKEAPKDDVPDCSCVVCLDKGTIGKNRPCPHCKLSTTTRPFLPTATPQGFVDASEAREASHTSCSWCSITYNCAGMKRIGSLWYCAFCHRDHFSKLDKLDQDRRIAAAAPLCEKCKENPVEARKGSFVSRCTYGPYYRRCNKCYDYAASNFMVKPSDNRRRYLNIGGDHFCGDPKRKLTMGGKWEGTRVYPEKLLAGDTIIPVSMRAGHRNQGALGSKLRVLAINLPFAVVGLRPRWAEVVNLHGMDLHTTDDYAAIVNGRKDAEQYQPLIDPASLKVGDKFVLLHGSWRGKAFRVSSSAFKAGKELREDGYLRREYEGKLVIRVDHLSGNTTSSVFPCEGLMIIPVNDQYVRAMQNA